MGTSVELAMYKSRIDLLRQVDVKIRFISFEPLPSPLGNLNLKGISWAITGGSLKVVLCENTYDLAVLLNKESTYLSLLHQRGNIVQAGLGWNCDQRRTQHLFRDYLLGVQPLQ
jgi:hypothetical protein